MNAEAGHIVIVGAGQAGVMTAESLRSGGYTGAITLLGDEPHGPYHRPPLSKAWLAGEITEPQLVMRAPEMLAKKNITLRTHASVAAIDRAAQTVRLSDGEVLQYTGLVLATGSTPRSLPLPGMDAANVLPLRSRDDASRIAAGLVHCAEQNLPVVVSLTSKFSREYTSSPQRSYTLKLFILTPFWPCTSNKSLFWSPLGENPVGTSTMRCLRTKTPGPLKQLRALTRR